MKTFTEIMRTAAEMHASDVHLTVGVPPCVRVNGQILQLTEDKLLPQDTVAL